MLVLVLGDDARGFNEANDRFKPCQTVFVVAAVAAPPAGSAIEAPEKRSRGPGSSKGRIATT